jgi:hypothetical protein
LRHFTLHEANALIPSLTGLVESLQTLLRRMEKIADEVRQFEFEALRNGHGEKSTIFEPGHDMDETRREIEQGLLILQGTGVHLKSIEHGILDFPTVMFEREVYLCWQLGEEQVAHWHELEAGFDGRRPL